MQYLNQYQLIKSILQNKPFFTILRSILAVVLFLKRNFNVMESIKQIGCENELIPCGLLLPMLWGQKS